MGINSPSLVYPVVFLSPHLSVHLHHTLLQVPDIGLSLVLETLTMVNKVFSTVPLCGLYGYTY